MDSHRANGYIKAWYGKRVAVVGDLMLDRYVWGRASRISQEAPIPVVQVKRETARPGGAANVLLNLVTLGAQAVAFGVAGDDPAGDELAVLLEDLGVDTRGIVREKGRETTQKTRVIAGNQQIVRVDRECLEPLSGARCAELADRLRKDLDAGRIDALIVEDYGKGVVSEKTAEAIGALTDTRSLPVALDPHPSNPVRLPRLTLMTPNRAEALALAGLYPSDRIEPMEEDQALMAAVKRLQGAAPIKNLLVTLGAGGMGLFRKGLAPVHVPTRAREVFDVSGAGDTVIASFVLALLAGAPSEDAAILANHAAGVVVGKVGTAPVSSDELRQSFLGEGRQ